jgi:hypothetical protein
MFRNSVGFFAVITFLLNVGKKHEETRSPKVTRHPTDQNSRYAIIAQIMRLRNISYTNGHSTEWYGIATAAAKPCQQVNFWKLTY